MEYWSRSEGRAHLGRHFLKKKNMQGRPVFVSSVIGQIHYNFEKMEDFDDDDFHVYKPQHVEEVAEPTSKMYSFQSSELPLDWSLKSSVSFQTDFQLIW